MSVWLFSSSDLENIKVGFEHLIWGFWDRDVQISQKLKEKLIKNWRIFIKTYNRIKPFDHCLIQIAKTGDIHALAVIKDKQFDDQTLIWPLEIRKGKVYYPWRIEFSMIIYSEKPILKRFIKIENYIDGYGLAEASPTDLADILRALSKCQDLKFKAK